MPEGIEVELYRRLADQALGRPIAAVRAPDDWYLKGGTTRAQVQGALEGRSFVGDRRIGKLLLLEIGASGDDEGGLLGLRFGMTGLLEVDDRRAIGELEYSSRRRDPAWVRFEVGFRDGGSLRMFDPRRLGGVQLDPPIERMGRDAFGVGAAELGRILHGSQAPLKARLMDQAHLAGLGNLLTDEILWRAGLDPARPAASLSVPEVRRLHRHLRATLDELTAKGGSHLGDLMPARVRGAPCPRCGGPLLRRTIGGRTTYSCASHQH